MNTELEKLLGEKLAQKFIEAHPGVNDETIVEENNALADIFKKTQSRTILFRVPDYDTDTGNPAVLATRQFAAGIEQWAEGLHKRWYLAYSPELNKLLWRRG